MKTVLNWLGTLAILAVFCAFTLWASILIPVVLGCALVLALLFLAITALIDAGYYLWLRIRSPPGRG